MEDKSDEQSSGGFSIYSWNINGIRTLDMKDVLNQLNADIVAVQETKISREQLDTSTAFINDCSSYFTFSRNKTGYSGVATYCAKKFTPIKAEEGLTDLLQIQTNKIISDSVRNYVNLTEEEKILAKYNDADGRCVVTQHQVQKPNGELVPLSIINVYCPRLRDDPEDPVNNTDFKLMFHTIIEKRARLLVQSGSLVLVVGDFNISHTFRDHAEGVDTPAFKQTLFRSWMDEFLEGNADVNFQDTFRFLHPNETSAFSCWNSKTNARQNNYGSRIDYIVADNELMKYLESAEIHPHIMGSDHCPISAKFHTLIPVASTLVPTFASKHYPELSGKQKKMQDFFLKAPKNVALPEDKSSVKKVKEKQLTMSSFFLKKPRLESSLDPQNSCVRNRESHVVSPIRSNSDNNGSFEEDITQNATKNESKDMWKKLMKAPQVPVCPGHNVPCTLRTVRKKGPTQGRQFWGCSRGNGLSTDPNANCNFFQWCSSSTTATSK